MKMFNLIDIGERAGSGVPELFATWANEGWDEPIIEERFGDAERTRVILPLNKKATEKSDRKKATEKSDRKKATEKTERQLNLILHEMQPNHLYKTEEIANALGLQRTRARDLLAILVEQGQIVSVGATKGKQYKLNK